MSRVASDPTKEWFVYVLQSLQSRFNKKGRPLPGFHYVGATTDVQRRLRQHNGELRGGGRYTSTLRPWRLRAIWGPYFGQSEALKAERALKHGKRGESRCFWTLADSPWCRGLGTKDPRVSMGLGIKEPVSVDEGSNVQAHNSSAESRPNVATIPSVELGQ